MAYLSTATRIHDWPQMVGGPIDGEYIAVNNTPSIQFATVTGKAEHPTFQTVDYPAHQVSNSRVRTTHPMRAWPRDEAILKAMGIDTTVIEVFRMWRLVFVYEGDDFTALDAEQFFTDDELRELDMWTMTQSHKPNPPTQPTESQTK